MSKRRSPQRPNVFGSLLPQRCSCGFVMCGSEIAGNLITACCGQHAPSAIWGFSGWGKLQSHQAGVSPRSSSVCGDVTLDSWSASQIAQLNIKASKADPFRHGVSTFLGKTGNRLFPIAKCGVRWSRYDNTLLQSLRNL